MWWLSLYSLGIQFPQLTFHVFLFLHFLGRFHLSVNKHVRSSWYAPGTESGSASSITLAMFGRWSRWYTFFGRCIENRGLKTRRNPIMSQMHLDSDQDSNTINLHAKHSPDWCPPLSRAGVGNLEPQGEPELFKQTSLWKSVISCREREDRCPDSETWPWTVQLSVPLSAFESGTCLNENGANISVHFFPKQPRGAEDGVAAGCAPRLAPEPAGDAVLLPEGASLRDCRHLGPQQAPLCPALLLPRAPRLLPIVLLWVLLSSLSLLITGQTGPLPLPASHIPGNSYLVISLHPTPVNLIILVELRTAASGSASAVSPPLASHKDGSWCLVVMSLKSRLPKKAKGADTALALIPQSCAWDASYSFTPNCCLGLWQPV